MDCCHSDITRLLFLYYWLIALISAGVIACVDTEAPVLLPSATHNVIAWSQVLIKEFCWPLFCQTHAMRIAAIVRWRSEACARALRPLHAVRPRVKRTLSVLLRIERTIIDLGINAPLRSLWQKSRQHAINTFDWVVIRDTNLSIEIQM